MAKVTVQSILSRDLPQAVVHDYAGYRPTEKVWTREYPAISQYTIHPPTATGLDTMFHSLDVDDAVRRQSTCFDINDTIELHRSEGDAVASWRVQVTHLHLIQRDKGSGVCGNRREDALLAEPDAVDAAPFKGFEIRAANHINYKLPWR
jgi:hypothetical protein